MWSKLSLRIRFTILSTLILFVISGVLTFILLSIAKNAFVEPYKDLYQNDVITTYKIKSFYELFNTYTLKSIFYLFLILLVGVLSTWILSKQALKPVSDLSNQIEKIDINNLSKPITIPKTNDEVAKLTKSFNQMLVKINASYEGQKRFAQNAAHELKTPISSILTNIEVLELDDKPSVEDYQEVILIIKENAERMSSLVKDLMVLNVNSKEPYSSFLFSELDIQSNLKHEIENKNINISIEGDTLIYGNKTLIERAMVNIIHNAIRYNINHGKISIVCNKHQITITDTGIGIPQDQLKHIFEPFHCVDVSRSRKLGGSGLGLAIVKQIFDQHQIEVEVKSIEKQGTTFIIKFKS